MAKKIDKVLVINSGSSSLKYMLFSMADERMLKKGVADRIGAGGFPDHGAALKSVCEGLIDPAEGVLKSLDDVDAIGHRVLHGGAEFSEPTIVTQEVKDAIRRCFDLGPLHNPANLTGIEACEKLFPGVPNIAVFDTAFHNTMPKYTSLYAIPLELFEKYHIRKYGFHGTSHKYVTQAAAKYLGKPQSELNIITCHLGNGSSLAAIKGGKVYDTTMGLTPLQGLVMGTRSGDIDPAVVFYLAKKGWSIDDLDKLLNKQSGLLAVAGTGTGDMRDLCNAAASGSEQAKMALDMFAHRIALYIGGYRAVLGRVDAIIFTGGIGENSAAARQKVVEHASGLGIALDPEINAKTRGTETTISSADSSIPLIVLPTNEELMIAREAFRLASI